MLTKIISNSLRTTESYKFRLDAFHKTRILAEILWEFLDNFQKI